MSGAIEVLLGMLALVGTLALALYGLRGADLRVTRRARVACPRDERPARLTLVQHVRTGQVKELRDCSLLESEPDHRCDAECARLVNLGLRVLPAR